MTDLRQAAQQALEALGSGNPYHQQLAAKVLRTVLEQQAEPPPEWPLIKNIIDEYGLDAIAFVAEWKAAQQQAEPVADEAIHAAWSAGYVEGEKAALEQQAEPVSQAVIAGALFDFMGWLTTRKERLILSSTDNASPAADAIKVFAEMRGLSLADARVQDWQNYTTQQQAEPTCPDCKAAVLYECVACSSNNYPPKQQAEPVAWLYKKVDAGLFVSDQHLSDVEVWNDIEWSKPLYTTPPQRQWVGLTDEDYKGISSGDQVVAMWADRTLKERNGY